MLLRAALYDLCERALISPFPLRLFKGLRVVRLLFFDDRNFLVVPFGQVSCGCRGGFRRGIRHWIILFFVRTPFRRVWWVDFGVIDWVVMRAVAGLRQEGPGVVES